MNQRNPAEPCYDDYPHYPTSESEEDPEEREAVSESEDAAKDNEDDEEQANPGGEPSDPEDSSDSGDEADDEGEDEGEDRGEEEARHPPEGWVVTECVRDGGDIYWHRLLIQLLEAVYYHGVEVEYCLEQWEHPRYPKFWKGAVHIRRSSFPLRAARKLSVHCAISPRSTI